MIDNLEFFKTSSYITGRPFIELDIMNTVLKNKPFKLLDIIYKLNFYVVIDHGKIFSKQKNNESNRNYLRFCQNNFLGEEKDENKDKTSNLNLL